jgi:hypothetical protein
MTQEEIIKAFFERMFVLYGETWGDYLAVRAAEGKALENLKSKN